MVSDFNRENKSQKAILEHVNNLAWLLDNSIHIPLVNYRIGWDAIVGLIPGVGDIAGLLVSSYIVVQAMRLGVPKTTLVQMVFNITIEAVVGLIPFLGDLFDATFKANVRNVRLLNTLFNESTTNQILHRATGKGTIAAVTGMLVGLAILIGSAGIAIFRKAIRVFARC